MRFILAIAENEVPSTKEPDPYMHVFLDAGQGNVLAFFELPTKPPMGRDENTPAWTQHLALEVDSMETLLGEGQTEADGIDVIGPTDHTLFQSIYSSTLSPSPGTHFQYRHPKMAKMLDDVKWTMLNNGP